MYLYFNSKGQLLERLEHGPLPAAGSNNFEIFAYFEGLNVDSDYTEAALTLVKPDLVETAYPDTIEDRKTIVFQKMTGENPSYFKDNATYKGFYFNFNAFSTEANPVILLDTKGTWKGYITLYGSNRTAFVQGEITFEVNSGTESEEGTEITIDALLDRIYAGLSDFLPKDSKFYLRVVDNTFPGSGEYLSSAQYNVGDIIYKKDTKKFYTLNSLTISQSMLTPIDFEFNDIIANSIHLPNAASIVLTDNKVVATTNQVSAVADAVTAEATTRSEEDTAIRQLLNDKQDKLPTIVNNKYLHTNATSGSLEWVTVSEVDIPVNDVKVNGSSVVVDKVANVTIPTNVSSFTNDAGYTTGSDVSTYYQTKLTPNGSESASQTLTSLKINDTVYSIPTGGGGGGTSDYTQLNNKPQINSVTLSGNKTSADLGLQAQVIIDFLEN